MPNRRGPHTYKGYMSPDTEGWPKEIREEVRKVYGAYRSKHPGESHETKSRGARIAWSAAKRKYPKLYASHNRDQRQLAFETRREMKEHPWAGKKIAGHLASDHIREHSPSLHTMGNRRNLNQMRKLAGGDMMVARQQRTWAKTADNEARSEKVRADKARKSGNIPLAKELDWDAKKATQWKKMRLARADKYENDALALRERIRAQQVKGE